MYGAVESDFYGYGVQLTEKEGERGKANCQQASKHVKQGRNDHSVRNNTRGLIQHVHDTRSILFLG